MHSLYYSNNKPAVRRTNSRNTGPDKLVLLPPCHHPLLQLIHPSPNSPLSFHHRSLGKLLGGEVLDPLSPAEGEWALVGLVVAVRHGYIVLRHRDVVFRHGDVVLGFLESSLLKFPTNGIIYEQKYSEALETPPKH